MKTAIITAADAGFFGYLTDLLDSIDRCTPAEGKPEVCILDLGLGKEQIRGLKERGVVRILNPGWLTEFPNREHVPRHFQGMLARPFFPRLFPEYELFIHLDADVWLQDWRGMELLQRAGERETIAVVPEIHRNYTTTYRMEEGVLRSLREHYRTYLDAASTEKMVQMPVINAGVWAMRRDVGHWETWRRNLEGLLAKGIGPLTDQCALNLAVFRGEMPMYPLPAWCNWICPSAIPMLEMGSRKFCEPGLPHEVISILHLNDIKGKAVEVLCSDEKVRRMELTWRGAQGA